MRLSEYITSPACRADLAKRIGMSPTYLWQLETGWEGRQPSPKLAIAIEQVTGGQVTRAELRPDIFSDMEQRNAA